MTLSTLFLIQLALVYVFGAITGRPLARAARRFWRRRRGRKAGEWDGYFKN